MTKHLQLLFAFMLVPIVASAQWQFQHVFPDTAGGKTSPLVNTVHGIGIDADGKVWAGPYNSSLITENGSTNRRNFVRIYNTDGSEASFSPIWSVTHADTLLRFGPVTGVSNDHLGNIYVSTDGYRLPNATDDGGIWSLSLGGQDKAFVHKFAPDGTHTITYDVTVIRLAASGANRARAHTPNRVGVSETGHVYVSYVFGASPIAIYDGETGEFVANVTTDKRGFSRGFEVGLDGTVYSPNSNNGGLIDEYVSDGGAFGEYSRREDRALGLGMQPGALVRYPGSDIIIATAGGIASDGNPDVLSGPWNVTRTYFLSLNTGLAVDSVRWQYAQGATAFVIPRSMAISPDGLTLYLGTFSTGLPGIQKFTRSNTVSVDGRPEIATELSLSQNYPNPFNPSTRISFTLPQAGDVTLKVYDMLGREVASLVSGNMPMGTHSVSFDASGLSSGIYLYELRSGNVRITNKMTLMR